MPQGKKSSFSLNISQNINAQVINLVRLAISNWHAKINIKWWD